MKHVKLFRIFEAKEDDEIITIPSGRISPGFVVHEEFQNYKWLKPEYTHNVWYYRLPSAPILSIPKEEMFTESLDPELQRSVDALHSAKIPTSPSCAGHWYSEEDYKRIFKDLEKEAKQIRKKGILLKDPTDGKQYFYKNPHYSLPWDESTFIEEAREHSKKGVIGIFDPLNKFYDDLTNFKIKNSQTIKSGDLTLFLTSPFSKEEIQKIWKEFENVIFSTLEKNV